MKGLSYASYSLYYYPSNEEENIDALNQDKVIMKLEKGKIIRDIFMDNHRFKIYSYDSSTIGNKTDLYIGLVETDYTNLELYIINNNKINGYLWKGDYRDFVYINRKDKNISIMIYYISWYLYLPIIIN